jgi:hypothetical protein
MSLDERFQFSDGTSLRYGTEVIVPFTELRFLPTSLGEAGGVGAGMTWNGEAPPGSDGGSDRRPEAMGPVVPRMTGSRSSRIESVGFGDCDSWPSKACR